MCIPKPDKFWFRLEAFIFWNIKLKFTIDKQNHISGKVERLSDEAKRTQWKCRNNLFWISSKQDIFPELHWKWPQRIRTWANSIFTVKYFFVYQDRCHDTKISKFCNRIWSSHVARNIPSSYIAKFFNEIKVPEKNLSGTLISL